MPRWASRITLEITDVRVERVQDITEADALAEGFSDKAADANIAARVANDTPARMEFALLWDKLNKKRGYGWETNPFVWVVSFKRVKP